MSQQLPTPGREPVAHEKFMRTLAFQYVAQARMKHEQRDAALRRIADLVDALRETVAEWRVKR